MLRYTKLILVIMGMSAFILLSGCGLYTGGTPSSTQGTTIDSQSITPKQLTTPSAPVNLQASAIGTNNIQLSWSPVTGADSYNVYASGNKLASSGQPNATLNNLVAGQSYTIYVTAVNLVGESQPSTSITIQTHLSWDTIHQRYANSVVKITTYDSILGVLGGQIAGTGWFAPNGGIVTNYHVVKNAHYRINITTQSGQVYHVHVVSTDPVHDLAILATDNGWAGPALPLGDSDKLTVGEAVGGLGHPGGEQLTLTTGQITDIHQIENVINIGTLPDMIMYDSGSVGGDSGSPVFDQDGNVIGVAESAGTSNGNIDFAVPVNYVKAFM